MATLQLFAVRDKAVNAFLPPFHVRSKGEAIRSFADAVNNSDHQFHKHVEDYSLWALGEYEESTGQIVALADIVFVIAAFEVLKSTE